MKDTSHVIFELIGSSAGETTRLAGFDWCRGELHVSRASADQVEVALKRANVPMRRKRLPRKRNK